MFKPLADTDSGFYFAFLVDPPGINYYPRAVEYIPSIACDFLTVYPIWSLPFWTLKKFIICGVGEDGLKEDYFMELRTMTASVIERC
jgi:hypothetical protein